MCFECFSALRRGPDELDDIMKLPNWALSSLVLEVFFDPIQHAISLRLKFERSCIIAIDESLNMPETSHPSCLRIRPSYRGIESSVEASQANVVAGCIITDRDSKLTIDPPIADDISYSVRDILASVRPNLPPESK
ncbi:hypothetical protein FocnCong_v015402 [Fusarium oxysporum f. sp. conglutinans]|nr:hypothetical protein FocnCong_v015402 [Fusarium oxysporum f. sp. conglutinans]